MTSTKTLRLGTKDLTLETGEIARQANAAVLLRAKDTVVLVAVVAAREATPGDDFFPLTVEYREKVAAAGRIPGGYVKREGKISDHEVLVSRLVDRSIRPLFPDGFRNEVQVMATVLSSDPTVDPAPLALVGAGAALHLSDIPWNGPAAGLRIVGDGEGLAILPSPEETSRAGLNLMVSAGPAGLTMVEGEGREVQESLLVQALGMAEDALRPVLALVEEWRTEVGKAKWPMPEEARDDALLERVRAAAAEPLEKALATTEKQARHLALARARREILDALSEGSGNDLRLPGLLAAVEHERIRRMVAVEKRRLDGRATSAVRPISGRVGWLPRAHGSALFTRGETQAMVTCTLASKEAAQRMETLHGDAEERFMLHYNFPPYSVGEVRPLRGPGRREIGHGNLARRALAAVLPGFDGFPYVVRIVSDISESNGSSSMATVCGGCLALMDAGVPVAKPVAGIAMGLVKEGGEVAILSDILGDEDHLGDMDFKVAGTKDGVTAVQMDNKLGSLPREVLSLALEQAREGRLHILGEMAKILEAPRAEMSKHAPRVVSRRIRTERIKDLIGPKGATIQDLEATTGADITVDQDGLVLVYAKDGLSSAEALRRIEELTHELIVGRCYRALVVTIKDFGAFVRITPGTEGLVHISELEERRVAKVEDVLKEGQEVVVRVLGVERNGKIRLSRRAALGVPDSDVISFLGVA